MTRHSCYTLGDLSEINPRSRQVLILQRRNTRFVGWLGFFFSFKIFYRKVKVRVLIVRSDIKLAL